MKMTKFTHKRRKIRKSRSSKYDAVWKTRETTLTNLSLAIEMQNSMHRAVR